MLEFTLRDEILEIKSSVHTLTSSTVHFHYINIATWHESVSGQAGEVPSRPMTESAISWAKRWYLPKVGFTWQQAQAFPDVPDLESRARLDFYDETEESPQMSVV